MNNATGSSTRRKQAGDGRLPRAPKLLRALWLAMVAMASAGCSLDSLFKNEEVPPGLADPAATRTPEGALAAYAGTVTLFRDVFGGGQQSGGRFMFVPSVGSLSDELRTGRGVGLAPSDPINLRSIPDGYDEGVFGRLQQVRGQASQAIGLLTRYLPQQQALAGHAYALAGYAEVFLAELFCSGIPLSTVDFDGDFTLRPGSTTAEVFAHASALFDTALTLAGDSAQLVQLARVGKARALLGMDFAAAAVAVVAAVPDTFRYQLSYAGEQGFAENFFKTDGFLWLFSVADQEGGNGLDYITSADPRTPVTLQGTNSKGYPVYFPTNYTPDGSSPLLLASGVEARLIQAEAALRANEASWFAILNTLRTDGTQDGSGIYNPGTGGVAGLAPLVEPATPDARVDLLFRERAFWLFLTGHRQGDLRRLIRQYGRPAGAVYPVGTSLSGELYGGDVTLPIPPREQLTNPQFTGCASHGA